MITVLRGLIGTVHQRGLIELAPALLVHGWLWRMLLQIDRLAVRFRAGTLVVRRAPVAVSAPVGGSGAAGVRRKVASIWPRRSMWLVRLAGYHAVGMGSQFRTLLAHPEMVELLMAAPQAARILRPMCRMLGVETSLLTPGRPLPVAKVVEAVVKTKRVRKKAAPVDWGRIPLPRGVLSAARRQGYGRVG